MRIAPHRLNIRRRAQPVISSEEDSVTLKDLGFAPKPPADGAPTPSAVESDGRLCAIAWLHHYGPRAAFASPLERHTDHLLASQKRWLARSSPSQDHVRPGGQRRAVPFPFPFPFPLLPFR